jgi:hypothetical protein
MGDTDSIRHNCRVQRIGVATVAEDAHVVPHRRLLFRKVDDEFLRTTNLETANGVSDSERFHLMVAIRMHLATRE